MRSCSLGGTRPRNTSASVPRLMPLYNARATTSSAEQGGSASLRISPRPGEATQKARAASFIGVNSGAFRRHVTIPNVNLRSRVAVAGALACAGVVIVAILARGVLPVGGFYAVKASGTLG